MNKNEFISVLKKRLDSVPKEDINKSVDYYSEMIEERKEEGMSEEDAVAALGDIEDIISQILSETVLPKQAGEKEKPEHELTGNKMQAAKIITVIASAVIMAAGLLCCIVLLTMNHFDLKNLDSMEWETNTYVVEEEFKNISMKGDDAKISFAASEDDSCKVVCTESEHVYNVIEVKEGTLAIERVNERKWNGYIGGFAGEIQLTVYLPKEEYEKLTINNSSGSVEIPEGFTFAEAEIVNSSGHIRFAADVGGSLSLENTSGGMDIESVLVSGDMEAKSTSGSIEISDIKCENLTAENTSGGMDMASVFAGGNMEVKGTSGSINFENVECINLNVENTNGSVDCADVIASGEICIKNTSGGMELDRCDAGSLKLEATSGSIEGTLLSEKTFLADAGSGSVEVPGTTTGGKCEVATSSGDIFMSIAE